MSELKVYSQCYDGTDGLFYLKSEADKVIDEKDKEIAELKAQVNGFKNRANLWHYNAVEEHKKFVQIELRMKELKKSCKDKDGGVLHTLKEIRHHKYKRCLDMAYKCAVLCKKSKDLYRWAEDENSEHYYNHKIEFFARWHNRWLELAEKFKEDV